MTPEKQQKIDKINKIANWCATGILVLVLVLIFIQPASWVWWTLGSLFALAALVHFVTNPWTSDEEAEQRKAEIKEAVRELEKEKKSAAKRTVYILDEIKIPLIGLTPEQTSAVHKLLLSIREENGHLKTATLVQILRALKGQGDLDDSDMEQLIAWVEYVTNKKVDERNFKYDYANKYSDKGVIKWGNKIRAEYDRIEIS